MTWKANFQLSVQILKEKKRPKRYFSICSTALETEKFSPKADF